MATTAPTVRLARRQVCKDVTLWPLLAAPAADAGQRPEIGSLGEALEDGFVSVAHAGVGLVAVESRAPEPVAVLAGEAVGAAGVARRSVLLPPRGRATVRLAPARRPACARCVAALAEAFRPEPGQAGFVLAVHDRAVGLEWLWPGHLGARRLGERIRAWAPWLLADDPEASGDMAPEALVAALGPMTPPPGGGLVHRVLTSPDRSAPWQV